MYLKFCNYGNIMAMKNVAILYFDIIIFTRIHRGVGNRIPGTNTDTLLLLPTP